MPPSYPRRNNEKIVLSLEGFARALLLPMIARAYDNTLPAPILGDPCAKHVLQNFEFDADAMPISPFQKSSIVLKTSNFDKWATSSLQNNPNATVLHLACDFDSRMQRVEWGANTRWIDIDLPEVIELRRKIQPVSLPRRDYSILGVDVLDPNRVHEIGEVSVPVLVIMEGLLAYLPENDARGLIRRIC